MGFLSAAVKSITGRQDRRRARDQSDANEQIMRINLQRNKDSLMANKRAKDRSIQLEQNRAARETSALNAAQSLSLRAKGLNDVANFTAPSNANGSRGTKSRGILV